MSSRTTPLPTPSTDGLVKAIHRAIRERNEAATLGIELGTLYQRYVLGLDHLHTADGDMRDERQKDLALLRAHIQVRFDRLMRYHARAAASAAGQARQTGSTRQ